MEAEAVEVEAEAELDAEAEIEVAFVFLWLTHGNSGHDCGMLEKFSEEEDRQSQQ